MSRKKCIFKKDKFDFEEDVSSSRCFQLSSGVQLKEIPSNGEEYLLKVIKERAQYDSLLECDYEKLHQKLSKKGAPNFVEIVKAPAPVTLKPTIEWQNIQVADFSNVRMYINKMQARDLLPTAIKDVEKTKFRVKDWEVLFDNEEPTMTHVVGVSQAIIDDGLVKLTSRMDSVPPGHTIDRRTGQWIYTLLAVTRYPHVDDTTDKLRSLARKCLEIRSRINAEDENAKEAATPLNLFICLIGRYFEQKDLAD
ncbi:gem-associated protein 2-like [Anticarsia gemmatalis]|uniref:gem-associated protein 2-like n=1 Tax=Anticarsia gemmatalis TaxID=129554 RepID=UPI003F76CEC3